MTEEDIESARAGDLIIVEEYDEPYTIETVETILSVRYYEDDDFREYVVLEYGKEVCYSANVYESDRYTLLRARQ